MVNLGNDWDGLLRSEFESDYYLRLREFLKNEYATGTVYPDMYDIFNALRYTSYADTRVVILGQDPYHGPGQAHGLCFSVKRGVPLPPSLQNIFKELKTELNVPAPPHGELIKWASQGVLLLNATLTVRAGQAGSHKGKGWERFTDSVITRLNDKPDPVIFLLWGAYAREKATLITNPHHIIMQCAHPSPLSAYNGFFGCGHFRKTNELLAARGGGIDWSLD